MRSNSSCSVWVPVKCGLGTPMVWTKRVTWSLNRSYCALASAAVGSACRIVLVDVIGLEKGFLCRLPVGRQLLLHMQRDPPIRQIPAPGEMLGKRAELVFQRARIGIKVDEDEPAPGLHPHLREAKFLVLHMREIPAARKMRKLALQ
jgi:hypothetical protein